MDNSTRRPTFVSLFTGIGGFDLGLEQAGWECAAQVELDPFCTKVLKRHWPNVWRWNDIRTLRAASLRLAARRPSGPVIDLLCGGFPCQDLSVAGKRAGLAGDRSGLFWEFVRVARALQPQWLLLENVPGLLSSNRGRDFQTVLAALGDAGYSVGWRVLDSRWFGVPQRRRRVFLVGHFGGPCPAPVLVEPEGVRGRLEAFGDEGEDVTGTLGAVSSGGRGWRMGADEAAAGQRVVQREVTAFAWQQGDDSQHTGTGRGRSWIARAGDYTGALSTTRHDAIAFNHIQDPVSVNEGSPSLTQDGGAVMVAASLTGGGHPNSNAPGRRKEDDINLVTTPLYYSHDYNQDRIYGTDGIAPAVCTQDSAGARQFLTGTTVRRLTPTECSRLQGFPDDWTCLCGVEPYSTWACRCPDSPRYASLGNAVTVPVIRWLGERLRATHREEA